MKKFFILTCCIFALQILWGQGNLHVSTGIDGTGLPLPDSAIDPNWRLASSPGIGIDTATRVVPYFGQWQTAPVPGSNAKWINISGSIISFMFFLFPKKFLTHKTASPNSNIPS